MGLLGRAVTGTLVVAAVLMDSFTLCVQAKGDFDLSYEKPAEECYILYPIKGDFYEVSAGDSLWKIAERLWGDGRLYSDLYEANREMISDPNLIYPGQILQVGRLLYLEKQNGPIGIRSGSTYQFDTPRGCTVGLLSGEETGANFVLFGGEAGYDIACLIRKIENPLKGAGDCEAWKKAVSEYVKKEYGSAVQDLEFEYYLSARDEVVCLYSYTYIIDLSQYDAEGSIEIKVCAGFKQSEHMQADFMGFSAGGADIKNKVRYVTASFEELLQEGDVCDVNDENMQIYPSVVWEPASFNAIAWIDSYFDDRLKDITGYREKEKSRKDKLLDQMREGKGIYGGEKKTRN